MRTNGTLTYLLSDHLGSTSITTDSAGIPVSETRYTAWGETRYTNGTTSTNYTYTGQYSNASDFGLMYYGARWYDNSLGRFAQADSIVPGGAQGYDRYAYVNNDPVKYTDPTGHDPAGNCYDKGYCGYKDLTPGQLIDQASHGSKSGDANNKLAKDIETYMASNPGYDPLKDPVFFNRGNGEIAHPGMYNIFTQFRINYWMARNGGHLQDAMDLMAYYDYHNATYMTDFDPSKVSWASVTLDVVGIPLGFLGVGEFSGAAKLSPQTINFLTTIGLFDSGVSGYSAYKKNDDLGTFLSGMSAFPFIGGVASGASLLHDLDKGFVHYYYSPSIPR